MDAAAIRAILDAADALDDNKTDSELIQLWNSLSETVKMGLLKKAGIEYATGKRPNSGN
jgi:hypothetical protein